MKYMGSKRRIAKYILPIILKDRKPEQWYVEPFVGGGNLIDKVDGNRIGADINEYLIEALKLIRDTPNALPKNNKEFPEWKYKWVSKNRNTFFDKGKVGYVGFAFSYGGKWFGGWRRDGKNERDYVGEAYRNAVEQSLLLKDVHFICRSYDKLLIPPNSVVYCDPPYSNTTKYKTDFDHELFWEWCRNKTREGHTVFVSEYNAPDDFECVWQKEIVSSLTPDTGSKKGTERLFKYKG